MMFSAARLLMLVAAVLLLQDAAAFSLPGLRRSKSPLVKHIPLPGQASLRVSSSDINRMPINGESKHLSQYEGELNPLQSRIVKVGMLMFVALQCITLPLALFPNWLLYKLKFQSRLDKERHALRLGQFCCRWGLRLVPFCRVKCIPAGDDETDKEPDPCVWVCNHTSMLDVFMLLAFDKKLRPGKKRRPIKIVYWKDLEENPVTRVLFQQCGFIPVAMAANKPGEDNDYDRKSFKTLLKSSKQAFEEGFDIGILPEGQLNPTPEKGLLPVFGGAYTLAKLSRRPIHMMALHGVHRLWHPHEDIGMTPSHNVVHMRVYPGVKSYYDNAEEFKTTFSAVVGHFGQFGEDVPKLDSWLDGSAYQRQLAAAQDPADK